MESFARLFSGILLPLLLLFAGGYFTVKLLPLLLRVRLGKEGGEGGGRALAVALAGTLGVGNIAGVATGIALGGPGAVFWMWVSALVCMFLKYAEVVLAMRTRRYDETGAPYGGAPYYMRKAFGERVGGLLGACFAGLCFLCSLTLGGVIQSAAAAEVASEVLGIPPVWVGAALGVAAALILACGASGVERACTMLIPVVCVLFSGCSLLAIWIRREAVPEAFGSILKDAFCVESGVSGLLGFLTSRAVRYGVARGLVSNEAGCGTAPIAHAASPTRSPVRQGLLGMVEVFVDTILLCTMTALVILVSGAEPMAGAGTAYALLAYEGILGSVAAPLLTASVLLFAFATVLCWAHYGRQSIRFLARKGAGRVLPACVCVACVLGSVAAPRVLWDVTDIVLGVMAVLNILALLCLGRDVIEETRGAGRFERGGAKKGLPRTDAGQSLKADRIRADECGTQE